MLDKDTLAELSKLEEDIDRILPKLPKHKVRKLKARILQHYVKAYNIKSKAPAYGTLNKGFTESELNMFLRCVDLPKYHAIFSIMAYCGLRIGEVVKIRLNDIKERTHELRVFTEKARVQSELLIPSTLWAELSLYIKENKAGIEQADGYLFYVNKETSHSRRKELYLDSNYVRNVFRDYVRIAGLDETYGVSNERNGRSTRQLHRLTTHSLRHFAITKFAKATNGNLILTSRFARHLKPETTLTYIHSDKSELYEYAERITAPIKATAEW